MTELIELSADRPSTDPADDLYDYLPFARRVACAISGYGGSSSITYAINGGPGSGKSTVLAYVEHELKQLDAANRPVIVHFNPWWFTGQKDLSKTFLSQLQAVLPEKHPGFRKLVHLIGLYSNSIEIARIKEEIAKLFLQEKKRIVIIMDDIDRLNAEGLRQVFSITRAVADFPYVSYLLALDRTGSAQAISKQTGVPGESVLHKIIQVSLDMPSPDRFGYFNAVFSMLAEISQSSAGKSLDERQINTLASALSKLLQSPRDLLVFRNELLTNYAWQRDDVHFPDFIATEALRFFLPAVYQKILSSPDNFLLIKADAPGAEKSAKRSTAAEFSDAQAHAWLSRQIPESLQKTLGEIRANAAMDIVGMLFPVLQKSAAAQSRQAGEERDSHPDSRQAHRACSHEAFPFHFRPGQPDDLSEGLLRPEEIAAMFSEHEHFEAFMTQFSAICQRSDAHAVSRTLRIIARLQQEISTGNRLSGKTRRFIIRSLFKTADSLLLDRGRHPWQVAELARLAVELLLSMPDQDHFSLLNTAVAENHAPLFSQYLIDEMARPHEILGSPQKTPQPHPDFIVIRDDESRKVRALRELGELRASWCQRYDQLSADQSLASHPALPGLQRTRQAWAIDSTGR